MDRFFKEVWSRKAIGRDFLRRYLPREVVAMLDLKALELVKGSFIDPQLREYHSDLLYRLRLKNGESALAYVLLEHKRHLKRSTPLQLLSYIVQLWQQAAEQSNGSGRVPPVIPVVVIMVINRGPTARPCKVRCRSRRRWRPTCRISATCCVT